MFFLPALIGTASAVSHIQGRARKRRAQAVNQELEAKRNDKKESKNSGSDNKFASVSYLNEVKDEIKDLSEQNEKLSRQLRTMQRLEAQQAAMATMGRANHFQRLGQPLPMPPIGQRPPANDPFRGLNTQFMPNFGFNTGGTLS